MIGRATQSRNGFVLPLVIVALTLVGALHGITLFFGVWSARSAITGAHFERLAGETRADLVDAVEGVGAAVLTSLPVGSLSVFGGVEMERLNSHVFTFAARRATGSARYAETLIVRIVPPSVVLGRPLSTPGAVIMSPGVVLDHTGAHTPPFADCAEPDRSGVPAPTFAALRYESFADWLAVSTKAVMPSATPMLIGPSYSSNRCVRADPSNWGDPMDAMSDCGTYFPVLSVSGDLSVGAGVGQGVLLVDGDLVLSGGFVFHGLVLVTGRLKTRGSGATLVGAVQANDVQGVGTDLTSGLTVISYSTCALGRALLPWGTVEPLAERAWIRAY